MKLSIFHDITFGGLMPDCEKTISIHPSIQSHLAETPSSLSEVENWLNLACQSLKKDYSTDFETAPSPIPAGVFDTPKYTPIVLDKYSASIPFKDIDHTKHERLYSAIIRWESYRIKQNLIQYERIMKDDSLTLDQVKNVLTGLKREAGVASETLNKRMHPHMQGWYLDGPDEFLQIYDTTCKIYRFFIVSLSNLYYEVAIMFDHIIPDGIVLPVRDFYNDVLELYPKGYPIAKYIQASYDLHHAQNDIIVNADTDVLQHDLFTLLAHCKDKLAITVLPIVAAEIDNLLLQRDYEHKHGVMIDLSEFQRTIRNEYSNRYESVSVSIERINLIDTIIEEDSLCDNGLGCHSIRCALYNELQKQRGFYALSPSAVYPTRQTETTVVFAPSHTPESEPVITLESEFREIVAPFSFTEIPMVKELSERNQRRLIQKITGEGVPYGVAMLIHLEYDTYLKQTYGYKKTDIAKHWAKCLKSNERTIRGNYNIVTNPDSTEDSSVYTACNHVNSVKAYYKSLLESN